MARRSFFRQMLLGNLALVLVAMVLGGGVALPLLSGRFERAQRRGQEQLTAVVRTEFQREWASGGEPLRQRLDRYCKRELRPALGELRLTVIAPDGEVLADSSHIAAVQMENHRSEDRPEVLAALSGRTGRSTRYSETLRRDFSYYAEPIVRDGQVLAVVRTALPLRALAESTGIIARVLLIAGGAMVAVAGGAGLWLSWLWNRPLKLLERAAEEISTGRLDRRVRIRGAAELVHLAEAINRMRDGLREQFDLVRQKQTTLETVLQNLDEGILATDGQDRIALCNPAARNMLNLKPGQPAGLHIQQAVRIAALIDLYRQVQATGRVQTASAEVSTPHGPRFLLARLAPVPDPLGGLRSLLMLRDVTELVRSTEMKTRFVTNASHELRTPVAAVRIAVDSLHDAEDDERENIVAILDRQVQRLEELTGELLDFNALESGRLRLQPRPLALREVLEWVEKHYGAQAAERGIELSCTCEPADLSLRLDRRMLEMALGNLLDNALKFTPRGGQVRCSIQRTDTGLRLRVSDTGVGISPEDCERVFDRFFQAAADRSGPLSERGVGLGLAIVRHAVDRLGGIVELQSTPGEGTAVTLEIPEAPDV